MKLLTHSQSAISAPQQESIINDSPRTFTEADFPVGTVVHQGDLILVRISELPASAKTRADRQLAEGSTQGSRHILDVGDVYNCDKRAATEAIQRGCGTNVGREYIGPVFCTAGGKADILHPEHGDHHYRGDMVIACVYQRNLDAEEREQRTKD